MVKSIQTKEYAYFVERLHKARLEAGLTQVQVAKKIGRPQSHISNVESGQQRYEYDWKLEGEVYNNSSMITTHEKEYIFSKSEYEYRKKGKGFLFCSADGNTIKLTKIDDSYHARKSYVLTKKQ